MGVTVLPLSTPKSHCDPELYAAMPSTTTTLPGPDSLLRES